MLEQSEHIDECLLAAYLTEGLPPPLRREIEGYLLDDASARDLLGMANDALEEARLMTLPEVPPAFPESDESEKTTSERKKADSRPRRIVFERLSIVGIPMIIMLGALWFSNVLTSDIASVVDYAESETLAARWTPVVGDDENTVKWSAVAGATSYAIVILNGETNAIVNVSGTESTGISDLQDVAYTFRESFSTPLSFLVVALNPDGTFLKSSFPLQMGVGNAPN